MSSSPDAPSRPRATEDIGAEVPLRKNRGFRLLWSGSVGTSLGKEIADLAYPLVILALTGSPAWAGAFGGVQILMSILVGIPAGELADRYDRRRLLLLVEGVRAVVSTSVVIAFATDSLSLQHLLIAAAVLGAAQPLGGSTRTLLLRALVPPRQLTAALTREEVRSHGAALTGPPLGGLLYSVAAALPFLVAGAAFLLALVCTLFIRPPAPAGGAPAGPPVEGPARGGRIFAGLAALWRDPALRGGMLFAAAMNAVTAPLVLTIVVILRDQGASAATIGFTTIGLALGGLAGAALVGPLHRSVAPGALMLWLGGTAAVLISLVAVPGGPWWIAVVLFLLGLGGPAMRVLVDVLIFRQVPDAQRGRAIAACMTVFGCGASLGVFSAGQLLEHLPPAAAVLSFAAVLAAAVCAGLCSRALRTAQWPR